MAHIHQAPKQSEYSMGISPLYKPCTWIQYTVYSLWQPSAWIFGETVTQAVMVSRLFVGQLFRLNFGHWLWPEFGPPSSVNWAEFTFDIPAFPLACCRMIAHVDRWRRLNSSPDLRKPGNSGTEFLDHFSGPFLDNLCYFPNCCESCT